MKITSEMKEQIKRLRSEGKSMFYIADLLDVSQATINTWCKKFAAEEQAQKDIAAEEEKEGPAPAATDASPSDVSSNTQRNESPAEDIITDSEEDVKPPRQDEIAKANEVSDAAEAVTLQLDSLRRKLRESRSALQIAIEYVEHRREMNRETESKIKSLEGWLRKNGYSDMLLAAKGDGPEDV